MHFQILVLVSVEYVDALLLRIVKTISDCRPVRAITFPPERMGTRKQEYNCINRVYIHYTIGTYVGLKIMNYIWIARLVWYCYYKPWLQKYFSFVKILRYLHVEWSEVLGRGKIGSEKITSINQPWLSSYLQSTSGRKRNNSFTQRIPNSSEYYLVSLRNRLITREQTVYKIEI